jgi:hypothetical protein
LLLLLLLYVVLSVGDILGGMLDFVRNASLQLGVGHSMQQEDASKRLSALARKYRCVLNFCFCILWFLRVGGWVGDVAVFVQQIGGAGKGGSPMQQGHFRKHSSPADVQQLGLFNFF